MNLFSLTTSERINACIVTISDQLDINLFDFAKVLDERENLEVLDEGVYNQLAGQVLWISSLYVENDLNVVDARNDNPGQTRVELDIICNYLSTLLVRRLFASHRQALEEVEKILSGTRLIWDSNFRSLLNLIILLDFPREDKSYRNLIVPLADTCVRAIHEHFAVQSDSNE